MRLTIKGIDLMHKFEGLRLEAYLCPANVPTIGWGNTRYQTGLPVKIGDKITKEQADNIFDFWAFEFAEGVRKLVRPDLTENQFSALVCFSYNIGLGNFGKSTLLKKVNLNPNDKTIRDEFLRWNKAGGRELEGLTRRRHEEAILYFQNG